MDSDAIEETIDLVRPALMEIDRLYCDVIAQRWPAVRPAWENRRARRAAFG